VHYLRRVFFVARALTFDFETFDLAIFLLARLVTLPRDDFAGAAVVVRAGVVRAL
jgi:hypothetical protein